jgi:hypothetical protein
MPTIANITLTNAAAASRVVYPQQAGLSSVWNGKDASAYDGNLRVSAVTSLPSTSRPTTRQRVSLTIPHERLVDGVLKVVDVSIINLESVMAKTVTAAEAADVYALVQSLVDSSIVASLVRDRDTFY